MYVRQNIFLGAGETTQSAIYLLCKDEDSSSIPSNYVKRGGPICTSRDLSDGEVETDFHSSWPASPAGHQGVWGSVRDCSPLSHPPKVELTGENMCTHTHANITHSATHSPHFSIVHVMGSIWNTYLVVRTWLWTGTSNTCDAPCSSASGFS